MATTKKTNQKTDKKDNKKKQQQKKNKLRKVGALWLRTAKNSGDKYMSGVVDMDGDNSIRVVVFKNGYKEEDKHPDYVIYVQEEDTDSEEHQDDIPF